MPCPDDAEIVAFAQGLLEPEARTAVLEHIAACPECAGLAAEAARDVRDVDAARSALAEAPWNHLGDGERASTPMGRGAPVGRYILLDPIGAGGLGQVFSAYDPELDRRVAIKLLKPQARHHHTSQELRARLVREAQALARVKHPNVVAVHDVGQAGDQVFIAMELVEGQTLRDWLREGSRSWRQVRDVFVAAGRGLQGAHAAGLVHRDFKPTNVLIEPNGRAQVADFGLARAIDDRRPVPAGSDRGQGVGDASVTGARALSDSLTASGAIIGTPAYMAPEQHRGEDVDARADQFAFCVAMFEGLYGQRPFEGNSPEALLDASENGRIVESGDLRDVPGFIRQALVRGLSPRPSARYESMDELLQELQTDQMSQRRRRIGIAGMLGLAAAAVAAVSFLGSGPPESDTHVDALTTEARNAAAKFRWIYPPLEDPAEPTAYVKVLELEQLDGDAEALADARADELRGEFAETLVRLGDEYWARPGGAIFATDYYAAALVFDDDHPTALKRATLTFAQLGAVRRKAARLEFTEGELTAGEVLTVLAQPDDAGRKDALGRLHARSPILSATTTEALSALVGPLPSHPDRSVPVVARADAEPPSASSDAAPAAIASKAPPRGKRQRADAPKTTPDEPSPEPTATRDPKGAKTQAEQGQAALRQGRLKEAERRFHAAVAMDRNNALALAGLGEVHFQRQAFETAATFFESAVKARPNYSRYRIDLGDVYLKVLRYDDARHQYAKAKEMGHPKALKRIQRVDAKLGKVADSG